MAASGYPTFKNFFNLQKLTLKEIIITMDLIDKVKEIANRIPKQIEHIETEEATKAAFIMPTEEI